MRDEEELPLSLLSRANGDYVFSKDKPNDKKSPTFVSFLLVHDVFIFCATVFENTKCVMCKCVVCLCSAVQKKKSPNKCTGTIRSKSYAAGCKRKVNFYTCISKVD